LVDAGIGHKRPRMSILPMDRGEGSDKGWLRAPADTTEMEDGRLGSVIRAVRHRRGWRQRDLAARAGVSDVTVSRLERGHLDTLSVRTVRAVASALDVRVDLQARWRAGDLDRLLNSGHSALHDSVAAWFKEAFPAWELAPEVSFNVYGERGIVDIVAWHPGRRALLIIELKTDIADVNELVGTFDRKRRLAREIVKERGWVPATVSGWVIVSAGRTNRARIAAHGAMLRAAFPLDGRSILAWLADPTRAIAALSMWSSARGGVSTSSRRVRVSQEAG
jgi:transcriptional regulator with XRE-family HTH domain